MKDKVLITGATGGLGYHLAKYFFSKGHPLLIHGRNKDKLDQIKKEIDNSEGKINSIVVDLSNFEDIKNFSKQAIKDEVKILINNAGVICPGKNLHDLTDKEIDNMIKVNLRAPILLTKYLSKQLKNVININSIVGREPKKNRTLYAATKWGLRGFSESLKKEDNGFEILDVYPTNIRTWPERKNAMDVDFVVKKIYDSMIANEEELILDGRINDY
tara:strand:- start:51 stop:698 length:648 start_codon:yes stop_codon:yes gene_type:complete